MLDQVRPRLSFANVVSVLALFVALGGGAYAVGIAKNSVKSKQIKDGAVKTNELADDAVTSGKVANGSLLGEDFKAGQLVVGATGPAGGDLAGTYPSPSIAGDAVDSATVADNSLSGADVDESSLALGAEAWREVGASGQPAFNNSGYCSWKNFGGVHNTAAFFRDRFGVVHLKGLVDAESNPMTAGCAIINPVDALIFTLPAGYRPEARNLFAVLTNSALGRLDVDSTGQVLVDTPATNANAREWVQLSGISFRCAPSGANGCP